MRLLSCKKYAAQCEVFFSQIDEEQVRERAEIT